MPPPKTASGRFKPPPPIDSDSEEDDIPPPFEDDDDAPPPDDDYDDDDDDAPPPDDDEDEDDMPPPPDDDDDGDAPPSSDEEEDEPVLSSRKSITSASKAKSPPPPPPPSSRPSSTAVRSSSIIGKRQPSPPASPAPSDKSPAPSEVSSPPMSDIGAPDDEDEDDFDDVSQASSDPPTPPPSVVKRAPAPPMPPRRNDSAAGADVNDLMQKSQQQFGVNSKAVAPPPQPVDNSNIDLDILSKGLKKKSITQEVVIPEARRTSAIITPSNNNNSSSNAGATSSTRAPVSIRSSVSMPRRTQSAEEAGEIMDKAMKQGFCELMGKFEGDAFEKLFVKVDRNYLFVKSEYGEDMAYDMLDKIFVFEDSEDTNCFVVEVRNQVLIFKMRSFEERSKLLAKMPQKVFDAPEDEIKFNDVANDMIEEEKKKKFEAAVAASSPSFSNLEPKKKDPNYVYPADEPSKMQNLHKKGQSVEDLLEGSSIVGGGNDYPNNRGSAENNNRRMDKLFLESNQKQNQTLLAHHTRSARNPQYRKELVNERIKQPVISVRRVKMICKWINGLWLPVTKDGKETNERVWATVVTVNTLNKDFCSGILLSRLVKVLIPFTTVIRDGKEVKERTTFLHLNEKTVAPKSATENLDKVLSLVLRSKSVNKSRIPSPKEILNGNTAKTVILLQELFDVYEREKIMKKAVPVLRWYNSILRHYERDQDSTLRINDEVFTEGDLGSVWSHFQSGLPLFCVIFHLFGQNTIGNGASTIAIDPFRVFSRPSSISEFRQNIIYVFSMLRLLGVEIIWEFDDWVSFPDTDFCILQLCYIYDILKNKQCNLPPAQGGMAGITSGPNGEPRVVGLNFADSVISDMYALPKMTRGVLLGAGADALALLPIDNSGRANNRYFSDVIPQGLVSANVKVVHQAIKFKEKVVVKELDGWKSSSQMEAVSLKETKKDKAVIQVLHSHNKERRQSLLPSSSTRAKVDNLDLAINAFIVNHEVDHADEFSEKNKQSIAELDEMMRVLEDHMYESNLEMAKLEEQLTDRYIELEGLAAEISEEEYVQELDFLEEERVKLESEKLKLQDHFERRLQSIKTRQLEIKTRADAQLQAQLSNPKPNTTDSTAAATAYSESKDIAYDGTASKKTIGSTITGTSSNISGSKSIAKTKKVEEAPDSKQLEKGWINLIAKKQFMNHHIKKQEVRAKNMLKDQWEPSKYKALTKQKLQQQGNHHNDENSRPNFQSHKQGSSFSSPDKSFLNLSGHSMNEFQQYGLSTLDNELARSDPVYAMFNRFRLKLMEVSHKWDESKQEKHREPVYGTAPKSVHFQDLIALPTSGKGGGDYRIAIRDEERSVMNYEDARRQAWYKQVELSAQVATSALSFQAVSSTANVDTALHAIQRPSLAAKSKANTKASNNNTNTMMSNLTVTESSNASLSVNTNYNNYNNHNNHNNTDGAMNGTPSGRHYTHVKPSLPHFNVKHGSNSNKYNINSTNSNNNNNNINDFNSNKNNSNNSTAGATPYHAAGGVSHGFEYDNNGQERGFDDTAAGDDNDNENYDGGDLGSTSEHGVPSSHELSTAIRWLNIKRPLILCDRKNQEFVFVVEKVIVNKKPSLALIWIDASTESVAGSVTLSEVRDVAQHPQDPTMFSLSIVESPRALKSTGGRAKVTLKCGGIGECVKYLQTINMALKVIASGNTDGLF